MHREQNDRCRVGRTHAQISQTRQPIPLFQLVTRDHPPGRDVIGFQGVAPYMFEVDGAIFLSHRGDLTARFEAELDQKIT